MKKYLGIAIGLLLGFSSVAYATTILFVPGGGTGAGTFTGSQLITGNGTSAFYSTPTTTASCSGSASCSTFTILGSSPVTISSSGGGTDPFTHPYSGASATTSQMLLNASSSIGGGTNTTGLTIVGGATTTGNSLFQGTSQFNNNLNIGANYIYGNSFGSGDYLIMNGASGFQLENGNNGYGVNIGGDVNTLTPGGEGHTNLTWNNSAAISLLSSGVLSFDTTTYQNGLGAFVAAAATTTNATSTELFATIASTTKLFGSNLQSCNGASSALTYSAGLFGCNTIAAATGIGDPFTHTSVFGQLTSATSTLLALTGTPVSLAASSTAYFDQINVGSTTPNNNGHFATSTFNGNVDVKGYIEDDTITNALVFDGTGGTLSAYGGSNCTSGQAPTGINGAGAVQGCTVYTQNGLTSYNAWSNIAGSPIQSATTSIITITGGLIVNAASTTIQGNLLVNGNSTTTNATTTALYVSASSTIAGNFNATGNDFFGNSTTINATSTALFATTASTTRLFGANLQTCNTAGSSALTYTGSTGLFGCNSITGGGGDTFGQSFEVDASKWLSSTTTNTYGINANAQGTTYGFGIGDALLGYASSTNKATIFGLNAGGNNATTSATNRELTAIGTQALSAASSQTNDTAVGYQAALNTGVGSNNTAIGSQSLLGETTGGSNTALGYQALSAVTGNSQNTGLGYLALQNTTGSNNIGIGAGADSASLAGSNQLDIGGVIWGNNLTSTGGTAYTSAALNPLIGIGTTTPFADLSIQSQGSSTNVTLFAIGSTTNIGGTYSTSTLFSISNLGSTTIGNFGTCSGSSALTTNSNGTIVCATLTGFDTFAYPFTNTSVFSMVTAATTSLLALTGSPVSLAASSTIYETDVNRIGVEAFATSSAVSSSTIMSYNGQSFLMASTSQGSLGLGYDALEAITNTLAASSTAIGYQALQSLTTGQFNTAVGYQAGQKTTTASNNAYVGVGSGAANTTTGNNAALGYLTLNTAGAAQDVAIGSGALKASSVTGNIGIGYNALTAVTTPVGNTCVGWSCLDASVTGAWYDTAVGYGTGQSVSTGINDTYLGYQAGLSATTGSGNTFIGAEQTATGITSGSNNILIGTNAFGTTTTTGNFLNLGNELFGVLPATTTALTYPSFQTAIGVATTSPFAEFSIQSNGSSTLNTVFAIGSTTNTAGVFSTTTLFTIANTGVITSNLDGFSLSNAGSGVLNFNYGSTTAFTSSYASSTQEFVGNLFGVASSTPWSIFSVGSGAASTSLTVAEYAFGKTGNLATSTAVTLDARASTNIDFPIGTSATTLTLCGFEPGSTLRVRVQNPTGTAGAITWATCAGDVLYWAGQTAPTQTTAANAWDIYSFVGSSAVGSSTTNVIISGAATLNF